MKKTVNCEIEMSFKAESKKVWNAYKCVTTKKE